MKGEESASFLKKRSKKLLLMVGRSPGVANAPRSRSFFASFFSKKEALTSSPSPQFPFDMKTTRSIPLSSKEISR
jgi:hypothetical protein